ncbi:hypothetical protein RhiirA5_386062 [Rhizophagus irregularis]|uniref:Uncharacterized protein n=1 Tax=Rhizophagus irregularis TaxID=588596 RepID=A0A2N0NLA9_9GLOM|nr:hypothetical protein RhiirA5_386062 [Rhizophagus irregularis]
MDGTLMQRFGTTCFKIFTKSTSPKRSESGDTFRRDCTTCPCYKCLIPGDQLNNMHIDENSIILQTHENMCAAVFSHNAEKYSIHEHKNFFWNFMRMNIYDAIALDRMHLQKIDLFPYMLDFTKDMIMYQFGSQIITKMDNRMATITPFDGLKILCNGYQQGVRFTGAEMRDVMKIIIFVLDELYTSVDKIKHQDDVKNKPFINCNKLIQCFMEYIKMYITSRKEKFSEDELNNFEQEIIKWSEDFIKLFKSFSHSGLQLPKLHVWRYHTIHTIRRYGFLTG